MGCRQAGGVSGLLAGGQVRVGWRSVWAAGYGWWLGAGRLEECLGCGLRLEVR